MKLKTVLLTISLATAALVNAQHTVMHTGAKGYRERGKLMYENRNYLGAIDQLSQLRHLPATAEMLEEAEYGVALSRMERDERNALEDLEDFVARHPSSLLLQDALMRMGNYYFYHGEYGDALIAYTRVREQALNNDLNEDLLYRMAYCHLQLANYDDARDLYNRLKGTKRYHDATNFYHAYINYANHEYDRAHDEFSQVNRIGELGYQSQYYICQIDFFRQDYNKVITLGKALIDDEANAYFEPEINRLVGESYYHQGNDAEARGFLNKYLETTQDPIVRSAAYALGVMDYRAHDDSNAVKRLGDVTTESDALAQSAYLYIGQSQLRLGESKSAAMAFQKAASMDFDKTVKETAFYNYAVSQAKGATTPFGSSIALFEQFLNDYPQSKYTSDVEGYLVDAYMATSDYAKALASIGRIKKPSDKVLKAKQNVLYNLGVQALQKGNRKQAAEFLTRAIKVGNYDPKILNESRLWLAQTQYDSGDYNTTEKSLKTYIATASRNDENYGKACYDLGYAQYKQKNYQAARQSFQKAIDSGTLDKALVSDAYDRIGDTYYYAQDFSNAEASYSHAISKSEGSADGSMFDKAMMAGLRKNHQGKIEQMDALLARYPNSAKAPRAMLEKGRALEALNRPQEASATYTALYKTYPKVSEARQGLLQKALVEKNLSHTEEAIKAYKTVIMDAPTSEEAKVAAEDLKIIYADRNELAQYSQFLKRIPNAPQLNVDDLDRLTFQSAEKAAVASKPRIDKMEQYLQQYPTGNYAANAQYYIGRYHYERGALNEALAYLDAALDAGQDAAFAEDALSIKSAILSQQGKRAEAIETYKRLTEKSSSDDNKIVAQLGILRNSLELGRWNDVITTADILLQNLNLTAAESSEVSLDRAIANAKTGNQHSAESTLNALAKDVSTETGAHAAHELAKLQYEAGNYKAAEATVNKMLDTGSPQAYWLAKQYILLSDIYMKQGRKTDARQYLESLKANYPGKEKEIFDEIDKRLKKLGVRTAKVTESKPKAKKNRNSNSSADNKSSKKRKSRK